MPLEPPVIKAALSATLPPPGPVLVARTLFGQLLLQLPAEHLAGRVARQLVHEAELARDLEAREVLPREGLQLFGGQRSSGRRHDERGEALAEALVGDTEDDGLLDARTAAQHRLDLGRVDVLSARDDHVVL